MEKSFSKIVDTIKKYNKNCDFEKLDKAFELAKKYHEGQNRASGEPYILHPLMVAYILAELQMDCDSIVGGILHDTVEDTEYDMKQLEKDFGKDVALLVGGVTKLTKIEYTTKEERQAENFRKMFLAMSKDIRVIIIKLADRLHNLRTLSSVPREKQIEKARETLEIYAPLAQRLGISKIQWELEDLCFRYLEPEKYYALVESISQKRKEREEYLKNIISILEKKMKDLNIIGKIDGRPKHFYSIYRKMEKENKTLEQIYDLFAVRVIVDTVKDCYAILGLVHELFKPMPGRFKDYIAMPKANMYQSLHTTLIGTNGVPFEVQIRTWEMHNISENGIAAHWKYKEGAQTTADYDEKLAWLRQLLDWQKEMSDASEFMETLKIDLFTQEVFVFTPKGEVINLPSGSNPIDFAYAIHSAIGNKMKGAKVNGRLVPLGYELENGDILEILTSSNSKGPSRDWLNIVKSSQAKNKIKQFLKKEDREINIEKGKELIDKELKRLTIPHSKILKNEFLKAVYKKYNFNGLDDIYSAVGYNGIAASKIVAKLKEEYRKTIPEEERNEEIIQNTVQKEENKKSKQVCENGIEVKGMNNCLTRLSRCCNPVPGDEIIGYITRGRGVSVHRIDCSNIKVAIKEEDPRIIKVKWITAGNVSYIASLSIMAEDRPALLMEITNVIGDLKVSLSTINARTNDNNIALINLSLKITDTEKLETLIKKIRKIQSVFEVTRAKQ